MNTGKLIVFTALLAALSAVHCIFGIDSESMLFASVTKVLPLLLLTGGVCIYGFRPLAVAALVLSMFGDVAAEIFLLGSLRMPLQIIFFSAAQICYASEFLKFKRTAGNNRTLSVLPFLMGIYGLLETFTLICASIQKRRLKWCFILGASLFLVSDALILVRFITGGFPYASLLVMITYYLAQYHLNLPLICSNKVTFFRQKAD